MSTYRIEYRVRAYLDESERPWRTYGEYRSNRMAQAELKDLRRAVGGEYGGEPEYRLVDVPRGKGT